MIDLYSPALAAALAGAIIALFTTVDLGLLRRGGLPRPSRFARLTAWGSMAILLLALFSHVFLGHAPGSDRAMQPVAFMHEHPMILLVAAMCGLALFLARPRQ